MSRATLVTAPDLVERFLASVAGENATALSLRTGIDASHISRWRRGYRPKRLNPTTEKALRGALGESVSLGLPPAAIFPRASTAPAVAPGSFFEHVLFNAGRIAELARQIEHAAREQQIVTIDLGRRAEASHNETQERSVTNPFDPRTVGKRIRDRRERLNMSRSDLVKKTRLKSVPGLEQIEAGVWPRQDRPALLAEIARALKTTEAALNGVGKESGTK